MPDTLTVIIICVLVFCLFALFVVSRNLQKMKQVIQKNEKDKEQSVPMLNDPMHDNFVFDFRRSYWRHDNIGNSDGGRLLSTEFSEASEKSAIRAVKPIEVVDELKEPPRALALDNIDDKIFMMQERMEFIQNNYSKKEVAGFISCLENRKKYDKPFFSIFDTTTLDKIDALNEKYNLVMKEADLFIPEFPDEAIKIMKKYNNKVKQITSKQAVFYVIATNDDFKKAEGKRDPILLAQSPFGFYYDILGAWDKEMLMLSEL